MSTRSRHEQRIATREIASVWLADHIGRLIALLLGTLALLVTIFLAAIGYQPALGLIVVTVAGVLLIALGGRMRGGR